MLHCETNNMMPRYAYTHCRLYFQMQKKNNNTIDKYQREPMKWWDKWQAQANGTKIVQSRYL